MPQQIAVESLTKEYFEVLEETFEQVHGIYLDSKTSLFETLETISAEEASRPVSARCASIAGQVEHVRFYLDVIERIMRGEKVGTIDWQKSWWLKSVTPEEWEAVKGRLRDAHGSVLALMKSFDTWDGENDIGGALAVLVHTAYHLGEIRQATCVIRDA